MAQFGPTGPRFRNLTPVVLGGYEQAASLTLSGVTVTAKTRGIAGNLVEVEFVESGNDTPLSVESDGEVVTVNLETDSGGDAVSTVSEVVSAINDEPDLPVTASGSGATVVAAGEDALEGGSNYVIGRA